jgi:dephospho-CoA kinase
MKRSAVKYPAILVLTGASGAGKTTLVLKLDELAIPGVKGINCDRVKIDSSKTADPSDRQAAVLEHWISHLGRSKPKLKLAVLDTQIRPHRAWQVLDEAGVEHSQIVLVDCDPVKRNKRLRGERGQPDLANAQMDCWAAYLRGQADALGLSIVDTSDDSIEKSLKALQGLMRDLLDRASAT